MDDRKKKSAADKKAERSSIIEEQIRQSQRKKEERAFLEELSKRITIAKEGKKYSEKGEVGEAVASYRRFLSITAKSVAVEVDQLKPSLFEQKTETGEALLISSILFDLLKILDKLDNAEAKAERMIYHRLFIRFTVNQPFQLFAAENLRKYLTYRKSVLHKAEFWSTYHSIKVKRFCLVATWAFEGSGAPEVRRLRRFRDQTLGASRPGRAFIRFYYRHASGLLPILRIIPFGRVISRACIRTLLPLIDPSGNSGPLSRKSPLR